MVKPTIAEQVLKLWGASIESLPTSSEEECDWRATLGGCRLLIEEKLKLDNQLERATQDEAFRKNETYVRTIELKHNNRLSGIVRKASNQLSSTSGNKEHDLRILWVTAVGMNAEAKMVQFKATLYGSTNILTANGDLLQCYFFRNSDFYRFQNILDGAIIGASHGNQTTNSLCLNPYSPNWANLRNSPFATKFPTGIIDPVEEERDGTAMIVDSDVDRNNPKEVIKFLEGKYKCGRIVNIDMKMASTSFELSDQFHEF